MDVHGMTWAEAREEIVEAYNAAVAEGACDPLDVVHGYGASGQGGVIRSALRTFLERNGVEYQPGEDYDGNRGHTVVYPGQPLPGVADRLQRDILAYCETPKTREQIAGKYRRSTAPVVDAAIKALVGARLLAVVTEGRVKRYEAR